MMKQRVFQPVLVRPGHTTRNGLAAAVALAAWQSSQLWTPALRERWLAQPAPIVNVRCAHLGDFQKAAALEGWAGSVTAIAGPLMTLSTAPREVLSAKPDGWMPWGTTESSTAKVTIVVNARAQLNIRDFCAVAALLLLRCSVFTGKPVVVVEKPLAGRTLGEVLLG